MATLTLISPRNYPLQPLVEAALAKELGVLEMAIQRTEEHLSTFEQQYHMNTEEFLTRYENDELEETLAFDEWIGEYRLLTRLREKAETVREIHFAY